MILDILPLLAGIFSLSLGFTVLFASSNAQTERWPFFLFALSIGVWAIFVSLFNFATSQVAAEIFVSIYYSAALLISYGFLIFVLVLYEGKVKRSVAALTIIPWVLMSVLIMIPGFFVSSINTSANDVELVMPLYIVYSVLFVAYVGIGLGYMIHQSLKRRRHSRKGFLITALVICFAGGALFNLILPGLGNYQWINLGPLFAFLMVFSVFYSIARHGLFDIRLAVVRTVAYLLSLATLAAVYLFVAFVIFDQLLGQSSTLGQTVINVGLTLTLAFLFQPIKRFFDRLTKKLFYKDSYNVDDFYEKLNKVLNSTTKLRVLLTRLSTIIGETLNAEHAFFFIYTDTGRFVTSGTDSRHKLPLRDAKLLEEHSGLLLVGDQRLSSQIRRMMISHKLAAIMPLRHSDEIVGYLCLGEHRSSDYGPRDRRLLLTIADELVIAIQNTLSIQEVRDLNASLEQRINEATKELRASNAQLQRLDEAKDEFISMASHQLRTPLTSVKGYISMLVEGDVGKVTPQQKHLLDEAFISSERMVRLIGDFLNVSRLQTGKFIIEKQPVDLAKLVAQELESLDPNAQARGMKFVYKQPKNIPMLNLDINKIQQVVMNFADNAIYYSKEKSVIKVDLKLDGSWVECTVKDTGIGVPLAEQARLFGKFFRATNARKQRPDGTGVGLFLAKKVIDAHDGQIIFESKEGKGSTFGFRLPLNKLRVRNSDKLNDKPHQNDSHPSTN